MTPSQRNFLVGPRVSIPCSQANFIFSKLLELNDFLKNARYTPSSISCRVTLTIFSFQSTFMQVDIPSNISYGDMASTTRFQLWV